MTTTEIRSGAASGTARAHDVDMKLEIVVSPVSDVEHTKRTGGSDEHRPDRYAVFMAAEQAETELRV